MGEAYQGIETDVVNLQSTLEVAQAVTFGNVPRQLLDWLLANNRLSIPLFSNDNAVMLSDRQPLPAKLLQMSIA
jgi:hypothetical protein